MTQLQYSGRRISKYFRAMSDGNGVDHLEKAEKKDQDTDTGHTAADDSETITSEPDELGFPLSSPSLPRPSPRSTPPMTPVSPPEPQPEPEAEKNVTSASSVESAMGSSGTDMPCQGCIDLGPCPCCGQMLRQKRKSRKRIHCLDSCRLCRKNVAAAQ